MNRRAFMACLGSLCAGWPLGGHAQSPPNTTRFLKESGLLAWGPWEKRPSIVTISEDGDPRLKAFHEARDFWNAELSKLGSSFRLGAVTHVSGQLEIKEFHPDFSRSPHNPFNLPETLREIDGDVIVALSDDGFYPIAMGWLSPKKKILVLIPNARGFPLNLPHGVANTIGHELGHVIGLGHNKNANALMCGSPPWCVYSADGFLTVTDQEKNRLIEIYPSDWQETPGRWKTDALPKAG